jgi:hypothetical protein
MDRERIQRHEAGHASALLTLGIPVTFVSTLPDATGHYGGWVTHIGLDRITDREEAEKFALQILCAWIEAADHLDDLPQWPLNSHAVTSSDEYHLAKVCELAGWDECDYRRLIGKACDLSLTPLYQSIWSTIMGVTDYTPRLDVRHIKAVLRAVVNSFEEDDDHT